MPVNTDSGHDKNVLNLENLTTECDLIKDKYKPSNSDLLLPALTKLRDESDASLRALAEAVKRTNRATNERELAFESLSQLVTRAFNFLKSTKVPQNTLDDVKSYADKIRGHRGKTASAKLKEATEAAEPVKTISTSELSYDNKVKNLTLMVGLLESEPAYVPNQEDLSIASLKALAKQLKDLNTLVVKTSSEEASIRIERDKVLYAPETGLVEIGNKTKDYVLSLFSASAPEYKKVSKIKFIHLGKKK